MTVLGVYETKSPPNGGIIEHMVNCSNQTLVPSILGVNDELLRQGGYSDLFIMNCE